MAGEIGSQAADRLVDLLEAMADRHGPSSVADLASALGVHRSIVHRFLQTLTRRNIVRRLGDGRYALGYQLLILAGGVERDFQSIVHAELAALADEIGFTALFAVSTGDEVRSLLAAEPRHTELRLSVRLGYMGHTPHTKSSAFSQAIFAGRPPRPGEPKEVREARLRGFAQAPAKLFEGLSLVASAITTSPGWSEACVAALYPSGTSGAPTAIPAKVIETAKTLSEYFLRGVIELPVSPGPSVTVNRVGHDLFLR